MMIGLILLAIVAYYMFNSSKTGKSCCVNHQSSGNDAVDLLNERYARGEIDKEEYLERKQTLSGLEHSISIKKG